jgi:hypothetical protein
MSSGCISQETQNLMNFISQQMCPETISSIINQSLMSSISKYIDEYIKREVENLIKNIVQQEIEEIKSHINSVVIDIYQHLQKNLDMLKSIQIFLANQKLSPQIDPIMKAFDSKDFSTGFSMLMNLEDDKNKEEYLKIINFHELNESNVDQKVALNVGIWAITRSNKELLAKVAEIVKKGEGLNILLRKLVSKQDKSLNDVKNLIIKKSL